MTIGQIASGAWSLTQTTARTAVTAGCISIGGTILSIIASSNEKFFSGWKEDEKQAFSVLLPVVIATFASQMGKELAKAVIPNGLKWSFVKPTCEILSEIAFTVGAVAIGYLLNARSKKPSGWEPARRQAQSHNKEWPSTSPSQGKSPFSESGTSGVSSLTEDK